MKSRQQENLYHAAIRSIADQMAEVGSTWSVNSWKHLLLHLFACDTLTQYRWVDFAIEVDQHGCNFTGVGIKSRDFTKEQATAFVAWVDYWCAEKCIALNLENV